eukprot:gene17289-23600_t
MSSSSKRRGHAWHTLSEWFVFADVFAARGGPCTHTLLTGGRLFIPRAKTDAFLDLYALVVVAGNSPWKELFFVERTGRLEYRMFADLDIKTEESGTVTDNEALLERMLSCISTASPQCRTTACVLRRLERHGGKMGFHIIWSDLYVDDKEATRLATEWMRNLIHPRNRDTIDTSVSATVVCACHGLPRLVEIRGDGTPPIVIDEFTPPSAGPAEFEYVRKWLRLSVLYPRRFDIRTHLQSRTQMMISKQMMSVEKEGRRPKAGPTTDVLSCCGGDDAVAAAKYNAVFGRFLTNLMYDNSSSCRGASLDVDVRGVVVSSSNDCILIKTASHFCLRLQRSHRSNHMYFVLRRRSPSTVSCVQHCHSCRENNNRGGGGGVSLGEVGEDDVCDAAAWSFICKSVPKVPPSCLCTMMESLRILV